MIKRVLYRVRQFLLAITSRVTASDRAFIGKYLTIPEAALFYELPRDEQRHSIVVAKKMLSVVRSPSADVEERALAKVGLLHDIGKSAIRLGILDRALLVLLKNFAPSLYGRFALAGSREGTFGFFRKVHVHKEHARLSGILLRAAGTEERVVKLVELHDKRPEESDPTELILLRRVDGNN